MSIFRKNFIAFYYDKFNVSIFKLYIVFYPIIGLFYYLINSIDLLRM